MMIMDMERLKVGEKLSGSICCDFSYNVLLRQGTIIQHSHLEQLRKLYSQGVRFVMNDESGNDGLNLQILNQVTDEGVRRAYLDTYMVGKHLFENMKAGNPVNIKLAYEAVDLLVGQMLKSDSLLLQLASVRIIDDYTFSHMINAALYAAAFGRCLNKTPREINDLCLAGLLHDMGKAKIPVKILQKPGDLSAQEYEMIKNHPQYGYHELQKLKELNERVRQAALQHHERLDGSGYPNGLRAGEISLFARIIAIVDIYDALTSDRCYRGRMLPHESVEVLMADCSVDKLDARLVKLFLKNIALYPLDTKVLLNNGKQGRVVKIHPDLPLRPVVELAEPEESCLYIDLMQYPTLFISQILT
ncbi:HD-GYP domain-containing protein [Dethiobacter alkaliphilus]|uniref:Metal dependent phosphohydrolase n=1 Tax=Dethiobacter alkaliphilus AHT 1 TaxID=555088 RepID=C0GH51_DETAL|nr:HD-GYP domain-containing protein [Dethiobacter alkaliphilus]EEG77353.1 metal dependent phosphohydrolase [Dethiobacter alkaliphilus AHT 1]